MKAWLLLLLIPTAAAQLDVTGDTFPDYPLEPDMPVPFKIELEIDCDTVMRSLGQGSIQIHADAAGPPSTTITGPTSRIVNGDDCRPGIEAIQDEMEFSIAVSRDAIAMQALDISIAFELTGGSTHLPAEGNASFVGFVESDYFLLHQAKAPQMVVHGTTNQDIALPVQLTSFSNTETRIRFDVLHQPGNVNVIPPDQMILDHAQGNRNEAEAFFSVSASRPGEYQVRVMATPVAAFSPDVEGESLEMTYVVRVTGSTLPTPGPSPLLLLPLAMLLRRR